MKALTGHDPRMREGRPGLRIEVELPGGLSVSLRVSLLAALAIADRYGHDVTADRASVWAEIDGAATEEEPRRGG